jgi:hypothetical protein
MRFPLLFVTYWYPRRRAAYTSTAVLVPALYVTRDPVLFESCFLVPETVAFVSDARHGTRTRMSATRYKGARRGKALNDGLVFAGAV